MDFDPTPKSKKWALLLCFTSVVGFFETAFLCSPSKPKAHSDPPASVSHMLGLHKHDPLFLVNKCSFLKYWLQCGIWGHTDEFFGYMKVHCVQYIVNGSAATNVLWCCHLLVPRSILVHWVTQTHCQWTIPPIPAGQSSLGSCHTYNGRYKFFKTHTWLKS